MAAEGYTVNSDHTLTNFQVSASEPQEKDVHLLHVAGLRRKLSDCFLLPSGLWVADLNQNVVDVLAISGPAQAFKLAIPVATTPITVVGIWELSDNACTRSARMFRST